MHVRMMLGGVMIGALVVGAGAARACGLDGVPSLTVDGRLVAVNTAPASSASVEGWTPFVARRAYPANHPLLLKEDRARVAQALPALAFKLPWRWHFGDGAGARGATVRHEYRRPGTYIITVDAYLVAGKQQLWFTFDRATLYIQSAEPG
jgi:PKD domain